MKAICPISGVPFRTFDSLQLNWPVNHPLFSVPYEQLVLLLEDIRIQEEHLLDTLGPDSVDQVAERNAAASIKDLTNSANQAIHERQWKNPAFRLYQTKHLVLLAFMTHAEIIEVERGYAARPRPEIIDSHFWHGCELFSWACTLTNVQAKNRLPRYKVSRDNEGMENLPEYIEIFDKIKTNIGSKYRDFSTESRLAAWEQAITILTRTRTLRKQKLGTQNNPLIAKWALTITSAPKKLWNFWYAILSSPSTKITFEGVLVDGQIEAVTAGDLRELYDWFDDNLMRPKGDVGTYHRDDSEFYFIARQSVLDIIRNHIAIIEQGTSSYRIVNAAIGREILRLSDDELLARAKGAGITLEFARPSFAEYPKKVDFIRDMARWRTTTTAKLLEISQSQDEEKKVAKEKQALEKPYSKQEKGKYEIL